MTLYAPAAFATSDRAALARLVHDHPFATLVTPSTRGVPAASGNGGDDDWQAAPHGEPWITHLPLLLDADGGEHGTLIGHFARGNPHGREATLAESIAIFHGPHAYVSPNWYGDASRAVPTWNYAVVHAHGTIETLEASADAEAILDRLVHRFEADRASPYRFAMTGREREAMLRGIVAFRMRIVRIDGKFKLSQNRGVADRRRVIDALAREPYPDAVATAAWMRRYADPGEEPGGKA